MYQLNANNEFEQRTKSVFDTLLSIESNHNEKIESYIEITNNGDDSMPKEPVSEIIDSFKCLNDAKEPVFKMPRPVKRAVFKSRRADYQKNPEKWKKYSLEDVKEFGNGANYAAAMDFLNSKKRIVEEDEPMEPIQFNKPLSSKKQLPCLDPEPEPESQNEISTPEKCNKDLNTFKKKSTRKNLRKRNENEEDQDETTIPTFLKPLKGSRNRFQKEKNSEENMVEDDDQELEEDADANESNQYNLFD